MAGLVASAAIGLPAQDTAPPPQENTQVEAGGSEVTGKADVSQAVNDKNNDKNTHNGNGNGETSQETSPTCIPGKDPDCEGPVAPRESAKPGPSDAQLRQVIAKLKLPNPTPRLGPDPSVNEWNMLVVGYPIWLWTDKPTHLSTTAHHDGLTFTLNATHNHTTFTMGDGTTKTCTQTTPKPTNPVANTSPTCGHTYQHTSPKNHPYTITATTTWTITWQTGTHHGTLTHTTTGTRTLEVGELHNLIVG